MPKEKKSYRCSQCGAGQPKWLGQCPDCSAWSTIEEFTPVAPSSHYRGYTGELSEVQTLADVALETSTRMRTGMLELDRVLGGGLVHGSVVLLGGDPGVGKSTGLLQVSCTLAEHEKVLYVTGEESPQQISLRAQRLGLPTGKLLILAETRVEEIMAAAEMHKPRVMVIDSIQTMQMADIGSAPGSVTQVRESAARLTAYAKKCGTAIFLVGHVTKSGDLAGPRVLEHIIDVVCYIEGDSHSRFRMIRAVKNRYGAVNELGVFAMTEKGLKEIRNPSAIFLSRQQSHMSGNVIMSIWEGSRPLLVEIQALVDDSFLENPKRIAVGFEQNRLAMLLAVLHRHGNIPAYNKDVFLNVVGGIRIVETGADLPIILAVVSSLKDKPMPQDMVIFGEVGLAGEIRPVPNGQERLREAVKHGFTKAVAPKANCPAKGIGNLAVHPASTLKDVLEHVF